MDNQAESLGLLASEFGVSRNTLLKAARAGRLEARKSGDVWLSNRAAVRKYLETAVLKPRKKTLQE